MKKFKDNYQKYYTKMKLSEQKKERIFNNIINSNETYKKIYWHNRLITIIYSILIIFLIGSSVVFAKDIIKKLYSLEPTNNGSNNYKCIIKAPIINKFNMSHLLEGQKIDLNELQNDLNKHILHNESITDKSFTIVKTIKNSNKIIYAKLNKNGIDAPKIIPEASSNTTMDMNLSFLTTYATKDDIQKIIEFEVGTCTDDNFDITHIDSLDIDVYLYKAPVITYAYDDLEFNVKAFFVYDNILYNINGSLITRNMIIDFIYDLK